MLKIEDFDIVDFIPDKTVVWNIGKNMPEGYIPFVYVSRDGCRLIEGRPKYAVKITNAQSILCNYNQTTEEKTAAAIRQFNIDRKNKLEVPGSGDPKN